MVGFDDYIKQEADKLGEETGTSYRLTSTTANWLLRLPMQGKYMQANKPERSRAIIEAFQKYGRQRCQNSNYWLVLWRRLVDQAFAVDGQAVGCGFTRYAWKWMPKTCRYECSYAWHFAKQDKWITPEVATKFEAAVKAAGKPIEVKCT